MDLPIVKSISYLNSEFFNFNKITSSKLYNQYLSLLNLDNDEYKILKRINQRENIKVSRAEKHVQVLLFDDYDYFKVLRTKILNNSRE